VAFEMTKLAVGLRFPEGPVALSDGSLLVCEITGGTISKIRDGGHTVVADVGGGPNGAALGPDGRLYIANNGGLGFVIVDGQTRFTGQLPDSYTGGYIQALDLDTGQVEIVAAEWDAEPLSAPNDLVFDDSGGFYFTDTGKVHPRYRVRGGLYYVNADRKIRRAVWPLEAPNGVGLSPRGDRVYVSETTTGRVWYWDVAEPGVLRPGHTARALSEGSGGTLLCGLGGFQNLDSMAVDGAGNVCVATLMAGVITVISPSGTVEERVHLLEHDPLVTNICFGGPEHRTAYVTCGGLGTVVEVAWPWQGLQLNFER
jgi:gluconolactonase